MVIMSDTMTLQAALACPAVSLSWRSRPACPALTEGVEHSFPRRDAAQND